MNYVSSRSSACCQTHARSRVKIFQACIDLILLVIDALLEQHQLAVQQVHAHEVRLQQVLSLPSGAHLIQLG